jgi:IS30 family transposase
MSRALVAGNPFQLIARRLSRAPSTICEKIKRNNGQYGYWASRADELSWDRVQRPRVCKLVEHRMLARIVTDKFLPERRPRGSPAGSGAHTPATRITTCHTRPSIAVCSSRPVVPSRGSAETFAAHQAMRRTLKTKDHDRIRDTVSVTERPVTVEDRTMPGHWEGHRLCCSCSCSSQIATVVKCHTRYVMPVKIASKDSERSSMHSSNMPASCLRNSTDR